VFKRGAEGFQLLFSFFFFGRGLHFIEVRLINGGGVSKPV